MDIAICDDCFNDIQRLEELILQHRKEQEVPSGFRFAKHSDEPLKRKTLGVRPSCFPGLISMAYIHPAGTALLCLAKPEFAG